MTEEPWTPSYPPGVRWDPPLAIGPVHAVLEPAAAAWPDRPAIDLVGRRIAGKHERARAIALRTAPGATRFAGSPSATTSATGCRCASGTSP